MPRIDDRDLYLHNQSLVKVLEKIAERLLPLSRTLVDIKNIMEDQASKADVAREMLNTVLGDIDKD